QTPSQIAKIIADLSAGKVDILIATHKVLSDKVNYYALGLVIIDEEQRFGVAQKETIKQINPSVDILHLSATPIPRTLEMALSGVKQLSTLITPPLNRLPIITRVSPYSLDLVVAAIRQEILRSGQIFYIHNNIATIDKVADKLTRIMKNRAKIGVAHSKLAKERLDKITTAFYHGEIDVLICTTIVETGIDIPNANTLIIDNAEKLGLVQLYQIRGRVGRSITQSFCYLFYSPTKPLSELSYQRLSTIAEHQQLGSGLSISMRDLELRGAGNFLGSEQSGKIEGVGYDLYTKMLTESLEIYKSGQAPQDNNLKLETDFDIHIPHSYLDIQSLRLEVYRKIDMSNDDSSLEATKSELIDRFGKLPEIMENIFQLQRIKNTALQKNIKSINVKDKITIIDNHKYEFSKSQDDIRLAELFNFVKVVNSVN
ncbi:MAG: transcription-repair coupling factor, partial [Bifidobacteriaceae bacterium]|nr:transcription-repair coupling factor [Bifidobacteriaceae bacterium]